MKILFGSIITGGYNNAANPNNPLFQHEYGHYLQSQSMGPAYLNRVAIPSALSVGDHDLHPVEQDANRRAFLFFNKRDANFQDDSQYSSVVSSENKGWDFRRNPFADGVGSKRTFNGFPVNYVDFQNRESISSLQTIKEKSKWYDYVSWLSIPFGPIFVGFYNTSIYNRW